MAKVERDFTGDFDSVLKKIEEAVLDGSITAKLEDGSDFTVGSVRTAVRMYERYSWIGSNRVAMCITLVGDGDSLHISAITAGGSQAMFFKINTFGEEAFLETVSGFIYSL